MSGADLIGPVPPHWNVKPLRLIGRLLKGSGGSKEDAVEEGVPCVRYGELYTTHRNFIERARTCVTQERASDYTPLEYGDVLFAASGETIEEIGKSAVNLLHGARCGGDVVILRPTEAFVPRFLGYATDAAPVAAQKSLAGRGSTVKHIYPDELREVVIAVPPVDEQQAIADLLDRETGRLDALVATKQRLIDLLAEKRKAIIATAVTRGLDPKVKLCDSGVPWLGEIPAHWSTMRVRHLGTLKGGAGFPHEHQGREDGEVPFFKVKDLGEVDMPMLATDNYVSRETAAGLRAHIFPARTVVFAKVGAALLLNRFRLLGVPGCIDNNMMGLSLDEQRMCVDFAMYSLSLIDFKLVANPGAVPSVNEGQVSEYRLAVPPLDEQWTIVARIARETAKLDAVRAATERTIALLKERRSALIAAAVTGQLDVGAAA